jgi:hypothetical protein
MSETDYEWVMRQLTDARVKRGTGDAVLALLKQWDSLKPGDDNLASEAVAIFSRVAVGHSLVQDDGPEVWVTAQPGQLKVADIVRVKSDAFSGELGALHNGRRGTIIAIRYGDIIVNSNDDKNPKIDGAHYSPYHLEKRIK